MKRSISLALLLSGTLAVMLATTHQRATATPGQRRAHHKVVVLTSWQMGQSHPEGYVYTGIFVYVSSASQGAPTFPQYQYGGNVALTNKAEAIAQLLDDDYVIVHNDDARGETILVKEE